MEKHLQHPEVGIMTVQCQRLLDPEQTQALLVFTATPGTDSYDKLQLLRVTSQATPMARPPSCSMDATVSRECSTVRSTAATAAEVGLSAKSASPFLALACVVHPTTVEQDLGVPVETGVAQTNLWR